MGDKTNKAKIVPRKRYVSTTTAPADAVNTTVAASGDPALQRALQAKMAEEKRALEAKTERAKELRRKAYRALRLADNIQRGVFFEKPMSDEEVDDAIAREEYLRATTPLLSQGYSPQEVYDRRNAGMYATEDDMKLAQLEAEMHNNFFLGGMTSPYISAEYAATHPYLMQQVMRSDAAALPYAMASGISFDSPSLFGAATRGAQQGFLTVGNYGTRLWNATTGAARQAGSMLGDASNASRWGLTTAFGTTPILAAALNSEEDGNTGSAILGGAATLGATLLGWKGYKLGKNKGWWGKGAENTASAAESTAERAASNPYVYLGKKNFWAWDNPWRWETAQRKAVTKETIRNMRLEWNAAVGDPAKEKAFIEKYNINWNGINGGYLIDPDQVSEFLENPLDPHYTTNIGSNNSKYFYTGPTGKLVVGAILKDAGRVGTVAGAASVPVLLWNSVFGGKRSSEGSNGTAAQNGELPDSAVAQVDSIGVTPVKEDIKSPNGTRTVINQNGDTITYYDYAIPE